MVAALGLGGFRISELLDLRVGHVDLARSRLKISDSKTEAGVREIEMTLYLRDELLAYGMDRKRRRLPCDGGDSSSAPTAASDGWLPLWGASEMPARRSSMPVEHHRLLPRVSSAPMGV